MLSPIVPVKRLVSCSTMPICRRSDSMVTSRVIAIDENAPAGDVVEARDQVDDAALAAARGPKDGDGLSRLGTETHIVEHQVRAAEVAEGDAIEDDAPSTGGSGTASICRSPRCAHRGFRRRGWRWPRLAHLRDDEAGLAEREEDVDQVEAELLPLADGQRAGDDLVAAKVEHGRLAQLGDGKITGKRS